MSIPTDLSKQLELQLKWDPDPVLDASGKCNGCGLCRSRGDDLRMCPVFRFLGEEEASPRAKANLLRGILDQRLDLEALTDSTVKNLADQCIHCQICRVECPAQVDVPYLAFRIKSAYAAAHGLSAVDRMFAKMDVFLRFFSPLSFLFNRLLAQNQVRWFLDKMVGLPQGRKIPRLAATPYLKQVLRRKHLTQPTRRGERKVALFLDTYGNYFDPKWVEQTVQVLEHNGINVHVPTRQYSSGLAAIASGHGEYAEWIAQKNTMLLVDLVRQGYTIVSLEPAAAVCLKHEYRFLFNDPDTEILAENTFDLCTYLLNLHQEGKLRLNFQPVHATLGYHAPCRSIVLGSGTANAATAAELLLRLIPGLAVKRLEQGCCGLAGTYGFKKEKYPMSLRLGVRLFNAMRDPLIQAGATDCSACKIQLEQGGTKPIFHPITILAYAYGLSKDFLAIMEKRR